jgi:hypothetical protein
MPRVVKRSASQVTSGPSRRGTIRPRIVSILITAEAYDVIPALIDLECASQAAENGQFKVWVDRGVLQRFMCFSTPGETVSETIVRIARSN